jgi:DNA polymerase III delta prime subunit
VKEFLWVEKYRPKTVQDCVIPSNLKKAFQQFVDNKEVPNLLLCGTAGTGKTSVARAMLEEIGCDYIIINGSMNGNIDTLRTDIKNFASTVSFTNSRKYVILDEADYLNANSTQPALRNFMEEFSKNCGFILTCNFKNRIIEPLHSRCSVVEFKITKEEKPKIAACFFKRVCNVLKSENVEYEEKVVAEVVTKHFPDFRRVLNELQRYSAVGKIDSGILANQFDSNIKTLFSSMKSKNFKEVRTWVSENSDIDASTFFRAIYDNASEAVRPQSLPQLIVTLADYQYKNAFVADQEINIMACLIEIMSEAEFK